MSLHNFEGFLGNTHAVRINSMAVDLAKSDEIASKEKQNRIKQNQVILAGRKAVRIFALSFSALRGLGLRPQEAEGLKLNTREQLLYPSLVLPSRHTRLNLCFET